MKRILLFTLLSFLAVRGYSQKNTFVGIYAGAGWATTNNYNVALSGGFEFLKGISLRSSLGATIFYQQFSLYYDNEANAAQHGTGYAGEEIRHKSAYAFICPKYTFGIGPKQRVHFYLNAGVGLKAGGSDSVRKWDHRYYTGGVGNYDSTIDASKNINSMVFRIGMGFKEYMPVGHHWWFTLTEDFGFLTGSLTKTGTIDDPSRTYYSPQSLSPGYISIQLGISHTKL